MMCDFNRCANTRSKTIAISNTYIHTQGREQEATNLSNPFGVVIIENLAGKIAIIIWMFKVQSVYIVFLSGMCMCIYYMNFLFIHVCNAYNVLAPFHSPTTLHYTTLHYTTLRCTTLHYTILHYTTLHHTTLHYTTLHYTIPHYTTLHPPRHAAPHGKRN
jgi:hypothetical protein